MNTKKKIDVNSASLVGLKAELFRKQEALRKERLKQNSTTVKAKPVTQKPSFWNKKNSGVQSRAEKDKVLTTEEKNQLDKSRAALEAKTKLYEQMSQRAVLSADDDVSDRFLVDFEKKAIDDLDKKRGKQEDEDEETEYEMGATDVPGPVHPDEEWVDYVDTLGRSRRCMKKDLPELIEMDKRLNPQIFKDKEKQENKEDLPELLSNDMYREMMRKKWEAEEEEMKQKGPGSVHYQNVRFDEVREMGVGYFDFSKDEAEREKQMEMLQHLRDQTVGQRTKSEQLKAKRKAALQARLEKVKQRKRLKGELVEEEVESKQEEEGAEARAAEEEKQGLEEDAKRIAESLIKTAPVRPWDIGKNETPWERVKRQVREERPQEFAPPSFYDNTTPHSRKEQGSFRTNSSAPAASFDNFTWQPSNRPEEFAPPWGYNDGPSRNQPSVLSLNADVSKKPVQEIVDSDSIAQALSFFRQNAQK